MPHSVDPALTIFVQTYCINPNKHLCSNKCPLPLSENNEIFICMNSILLLGMREFFEMGSTLKGKNLLLDIMRELFKWCLLLKSYCTVFHFALKSLEIIGIVLS